MTDDTRTHWAGNKETVCGQGSTVAATKAFREWLPGIAEKYNIKTVADVGCGDENWQDLIKWNVERDGYDIEHKSPSFNCITQVLPKPYDLVMCLYVTVHMTKWEYLLRTVANFRESGSKYLLLTYTQAKTRVDYLWEEPWPSPILAPPLENFLAHDNPKRRWFHGLWRLNG